MICSINHVSHPIHHADICLPAISIEGEHAVDGSRHIRQRNRIIINVVNGKRSKRFHDKKSLFAVPHAIAGNHFPLRQFSARRRIDRLLSRFAAQADILPVLRHKQNIPHALPVECGQKTRFPLQINSSLSLRKEITLHCPRQKSRRVQPRDIRPFQLLHQRAKIAPTVCVDIIFRRMQSIHQTAADAKKNHRACRHRHPHGAFDFSSVFHGL